MDQSGIRPLEYKVLVKPKIVEEKTAGGIYIPDTTKEKEKFAQQEGEVVAIGAIAFTDPDWLDKPKVGDTVLFDKYAGGKPVEGRDGEEYRLINDKEIMAVIYG